MADAVASRLKSADLRLRGVLQRWLLKWRRLGEFGLQAVSRQSNACPIQREFMPRVCETGLLTLCTLSFGLVLGVGVFAAAQEASPATEAAGIERVSEPSPLLREPKTPADLFAAAVQMVELARLDLADRYLAELLKQDPSDELLIQLRDRHGTGEFVKLARIKELSTNGLALLERLNAASRKQAASADYVNVLIQKLGGDADTRELAIGELRNLGIAGIPHLIRKLAAPDSAEQSDQIIYALSRIGRSAVPVLTAGLDSPSELVRFAVLDALGKIRGQSAVPYLWHPAFFEQEPAGVRDAARRALVRILSETGRHTEWLSSTTASAELRRISRSLYQRRFELPVEDDGRVVLWTWDDDAQTVVSKAYSPDLAALFLATRFSRQAFDLSPDQPDPQRVYLASLLGWTVAVNGRDRPISLDPGTPGYVALTAGEDAVNGVLAEALAAGQAGTAQAALQILNQIGSLQQVLGKRGRKSPVLAALNFPDTRVQFAAANVLLRLEPQQSFPGADRVTAILTQAITSAEVAKAVIVDADRRRAETTTGFLSNLGFTPVVARTGKEAFQKASTLAGVELIVLDINCVQWDLSQTVANLRADARTAYLPIVLYGPEEVGDIQTKAGRRNAMAFPEAASSIWKGTLPPGGRVDPINSTSRTGISRLLARSGPAIFVAQSGSAEDFEFQIRPFLAAIRGGALTEQERALRKTAAGDWFARLALAENSQVFPLELAENALSSLVDDPAQSLNALLALSSIGTVSVQSRLMSVALDRQLDPAVRSSAANHLAEHMHHHGIMLKEDQVLRLTSAWKTEEEPSVATALAAVIGSLHPNEKTIGERLNALPTPR